MASSGFFHKPELALRRAVELQSIRQEEAALSLLHDALSSRRHRTWSPPYEQIMLEYLDLCLRLNKSREAKDGLHQYRNLSQSQAPGSLEKVIRYLMDKAEKKCTEAKAFVDAASLAQATGGDDDDEGGGFGASPQAILLSTMSTDPAKSQRDATMLLPSLKFLWETYRTILDILRSNSKLEHVYHTAAQAALRFCRLYKRRIEFRHLCDMLRLHLGNLRQYGSLTDSGDDTKTFNKVRGWEGWTTESIELHLQTRFAQLETAAALHRYTEGFRTVEDIYNVLQISQARRKAHPDAPPPKAKLMAAYYEKLTTLFWVSENYLFHAFAWYKYYTLCREYGRGMTEDTKRMQASAVLLAALCIPQVPKHLRALEGKQHGFGVVVDDDFVQQKTSRMATLLGFHTRYPTREALLVEIRSKNILDQVPPYLRELFILLEETADPLVMVEQARPLLEQLKQEVGATTSTDQDNEDVQDTTLGRYVAPLTNVLLLRLIVTLSAAYHTVSIDHLKNLTSGLGLTFEQVEKKIVQFTIQTKDLSVRIDHRAGCLRFGDAQLESDVMRSQLTVLAKQLAVIARVLKPIDVQMLNAVRGQKYDEIRANVDAEHAAVLERKNLIEKRKEEAERQALEKIREEARIKAEEEIARKIEEEKRRAQEQRQREQEKQLKIQQELDNQEKKRFLVAMGRKAEELSEEQIAKIDTEALQREHQEKIDKKKEEAEKKNREAAKKLDYLVRAIRIEELPLIRKMYEDKVKADREHYELEQKEKMKNAKIQWEADVIDKATLQEHSVFSCFEQFETTAMVLKKKQHEEVCLLADKEAEIEAERAKLRRARKRKEDEQKRLVDEENRKREQEEARKEEEARRKHEEALRQQDQDEAEEERRNAEERRSEDDRRKKESTSSNDKKYVPPSMRSRTDGASDSRPSRFGDAGGYPGGGRYDGRSGAGQTDDRRGGWGDSKGGGDGRGGSGENRGGDRRGFEDRGGSRRDDQDGRPRENARWR